MKVLILVGSGDANSHSLHLGQAIDASLNQKGVKTTFLNLVEYALPPYNRSVERAKSYDTKTSEYLNLIHEADAFVWVTPIYHNSFSGILKNALDWAHFFKPDKVVGMASNGGGRSAVAVDQLLIVARSQHMIASPERVCTDETDYDEQLNIVDEKIISRIEGFNDELIKLTKKIRP